jgi:hypothetical protein
MGDVWGILGDGLLSSRSDKVLPGDAIREAIPGNGSEEVGRIWVENATFKSPTDGKQCSISLEPAYINPDYFRPDK